VSIAKNIGKVHNEDSFIGDDALSVSFQDTGADQKIAYLIRRQLDEITADQQGSDNLESVADRTELGRSPLDIVKYLNENTSDIISGNFLADTFTNLENQGFSFLGSREDPKLKDRDYSNVISSVQDRIKNVRVKAQLNNKFIRTLLGTVAHNPTNIFEDEIGPILSEAERIQEKAISQKPSTILDGKDYDFEILDFLEFRANIDPNAFDSTVQVIGYVFDKAEYTPDGNRIVKSPVIVENPESSTVVDLNVKYGTTYGYSVRSVVYVEIAVEDKEFNSIGAISFLVCSKNSAEQIVWTEEYIAPPEVADFNVAWDYTQEAARLTWSFPVNPQRDIKYFQVFRRATIDEPFELLKMYAFNDIVGGTVLPETPDPVLVEKLTSPRSIYFDKEFTKDSRFIYSICSVDAHGFTSNYSIQFECWFDRFANRLLKKAVSLSGAPRVYPNAFLLRDAFVDTIRDSGHKKLDIYFTPEYLGLTNEQGDDLGLLKTTPGDKYQLQMINVDLQDQQMVDIAITDRRPMKNRK
jgi:hypothetical protein